VRERRFAAAAAPPLSVINHVFHVFHPLVAISGSTVSLLLHQYVHRAFSVYLDSALPASQLVLQSIILAAVN
jgi:hypothetical protein